MNLGSFYTDADRTEAARKYWNGEQILREYPSYYSQPRPSGQIDEIVARIRAANKAEGWYKGL